MTDDGTGLMTIGALARTTGLTARTIRYWSDEGALPPVTRSPGGYRLYDAASVARLELIRTLRELGLGLDAVRRVLAGETTVAQVAAAHVSALDAQISSLRVTRAVLSTVARRGSTAEEMTLMNKLARLSAAERRRIIEDFMAEVFAGIDTADPDIRTRLRFAAADLPDDPTSEQVDAWVELAELIQDPEFRATMRRMIEFNAADRGPDVPAGSSLWFVSRLVRLAGDALREGVAPDSPRGRRHPARADRRRRPRRRTRTPHRGDQRPARPLPGTVGDRERRGAPRRPRGAVQMGGRRTGRSDGRLI
ncbi:DNA-binding transcriptional MerR regulator [Streptomyces ambofaciens]